VRLFFCSLLLATMSTGLTGAARAQARPGTADIRIEARTPNAVRVEARYVLGPSPQPLEIRVLTRPCMVIEHVRLERNGVRLATAEARHGPWITWRDTTPPTGDSISLLVQYDVWLGGSRTIPLALLTNTLTGNDPSRQGVVAVAVRFIRVASEIEFPQMTRQAPDQWAGRYIAAPSFVKVGGPAFACDRLPAVAGDDGGLVRRYWLLLGIMVAWVPVYLLWARRTGEQA
jgi:hypothetical protein